MDQGKGKTSSRKKDCMEPTTCIKEEEKDQMNSTHQPG